jgi:hypothetical protein
VIPPVRPLTSRHLSHPLLSAAEADPQPAADMLKSHL